MWPLRRASAVRSRAPDAAITPVAVGTLGTLTGLVSAISEISLDAIPPSARLSSDLNMDSLQRVELLGVIEEEMGVFVDDSALDEATVGQIAALIDASREAKHEHGVLAWPLHPVTRAVGMTFQELFTAPLLNLFYRIRITGQEHLAEARGTGAVRVEPLPPYR